MIEELLILNEPTPDGWTDLKDIPEELGSTLSERLQRWIAFKKAGISFIENGK